MKAKRRSNSVKSKRGRSSRKKGQRGERLVIDRLQPIVDRIYALYGKKPPLLQRNTLQSDAGGTDVVGLPWLAIEVKNCATLAVDKWWMQTLEQVVRHQHAIPGIQPVLFYKASRGTIRVRLYMKHELSNGQRLTGVSEVSFDQFCRYLGMELHARLKAK